MIVGVWVGGSLSLSVCAPAEGGVGGNGVLYCSGEKGGKDECRRDIVAEKCWYGRRGEQHKRVAVVVVVFLVRRKREQRVSFERVWVDGLTGTMGNVCRSASRWAFLARSHKR